MAEETGSAATRAEEIAELKRQMEEMQKRLEQLSAAEAHAAGDSVDADSAVEPDAACVSDDAKGTAPVDAQIVAAEVVEESAEGAAFADDVLRASVADASSDSSAAVLSDAPAPHAEVTVEAVPVAGDAAATEAPAAYGAHETDEEYTAAAVADFMPQSDPPQPAPPVYGAAAGYTPQPGQSGPYAQQQAQQPPASPFGQQPYAQQPGQAAYYQQSGNYYSAPQGGYAQPQGGYQSQYQQPLVRTKDHVAAGLLAIFLGVFGVHKFYLGYNTAGFILLGVTILGGIFTFGIAASVVWLIGIIEGVMYLTKSQPEFEQIYVFNKREWF